MGLYTDTLVKRHNLPICAWTTAVVRGDERNKSVKKGKCSPYSITER